jgi:hypothetical protein
MMNQMMQKEPTKDCPKTVNSRISFTTNKNGAAEKRVG